jgi:hypothetical protein
MFQRRSFGRIIASAASLFGLSACTSLSTVLTGSSVPVLQDVQTWVQLLAQQIPEFINDSITAGALKGAAADNAEQAVAVFEKLASQFLDASKLPNVSSVDISKLVTEVLTAVSTIVAAIPAAAAYAPLVNMVAAIISAFLAATPIVQPAVPAKAELSHLHMMARKV